MKKRLVRKKLVAEEAVVNKMKKVEIEIKGMSCGGCAKGVEEFLSKTDGIENVRVSLGESKAFLEVSDEMDESLLRYKIEEAGYKSGEIEFK